MRRNALPLFCGFAMMMVIAIVMAACGAPQQDNADKHSHTGNSDSYGYSVIHMNVDGYRVACVVDDQSQSLSCDWNHRRPIQ